MRPGPPPEMDAGIAELAMMVSVAVHVEPELLRHARLQLTTGLDVGAEADLWFGPWVATRATDAIVLRSEIRDRLRSRVAERLATTDPAEDSAHRIWDVLAEVHASLSPALLLEERLVWLTLLPGDHRAEIEKTLRPAVNAVITEGRTGVADWFGAAWSRLPEPVQRTLAGWQLAQLSGRDLATVAPDSLGLGDVEILAHHLPQVQVAVTRDGDTLVLGGRGGSTFPVAATQPRLVTVSWLSSGTVTAVPVRIPEETPQSVVIGDVPVAWLHTAGGAVHEIGGSVAGPPVYIWADGRPAAGWGRVDALWKLLRAAGVDARLRSDLTEEPLEPTSRSIVLCRPQGDPDGDGRTRPVIRGEIVPVLLGDDRREDLPLFAQHLAHQAVHVPELTMPALSGLIEVLSRPVTPSRPTDPSWAAAVHVRGRDGSAGMVGSGVLIGESRVLTSSRVVGETSVSSITVSFPARTGAESYQVRVVKHAAVPGTDVAVLELTDPVPMPPVRLEKLPARVLRGLPWSGFGVTTTDRDEFREVLGAFGPSLGDNGVLLESFDPIPAGFAGAGLLLPSHDAVVAVILGARSDDAMVQGQAITLVDFDRWFPPGPDPTPAAPAATAAVLEEHDGNWEFAHFEYRAAGTYGNDQYMDWTATFHHPGGVLRWGTDERYDDLRHLNRAGAAGWQAYGRQTRSSPDEPNRLVSVTYLMRREIPGPQ